jgi:23S rRNA maturation mini-RNase III
MDKVDALIFIDLNQYLDLYRVVEGKKLLGSLQEQREYIFVTKQVVAEVQSIKLKTAVDFLTKHFEQLKVRGLGVPDHIFDISGEITTTLREKLADLDKSIKEINNRLKNAAVQTLQQVSLSKDEISKALASLFDKAVIHTPEEIQRARERRERGNPPGKKSDPLGDQLTWEQLLSHCKGKSKIWIISRDRDYCTEYFEEVSLNPLLYQDLTQICQPTMEVFCFKNLGKGLDHFVSVTDVKADKLPSPEELQKIQEEHDSLPPLGWLSTMNYPNYPARQSHAQQRSFFHPGVMGWHPGMQPDTDNP